MHDIRDVQISRLHKVERREEVSIARRIASVAVELPLRKDVLVGVVKLKPMGLGSEFSSESFSVLSTTVVY
jgi:hypothetical protein